MMTTITERLKRFKNPDLLHSALGIEEPEDIDIEAIAQYCGATVCYEYLRGCEGRIIGYEDKAVITVNKSSSRGRQRFSAGHELGHWIFDRGTVFICTEDVFNNEWAEIKNKSTPETRANRYAANLLLPESIFNPIAQNKEIIFDTVKSLADKFQTSLTATAIRLVELGSLPAIVTFYKSNKRKWFIRGPEVPDILWPENTVHEKTKAHQLLNGKVTNVSPDETYADYWITHRNSKDYYICEDSIRIGSDGILTLLWWKDEKQLLDLDEDSQDSDEWEPPHY